MMEAIILPGGLDSNLSSDEQENSNSMSLIQGRPFMEYILDHYVDQGVSRFIFSPGKKSQGISAYFGNTYRNARIEYTLEENNLGSGGAIINAISLVESDHVLVVNGDSFFATDIKEQFVIHMSNEADVTMAVRSILDFDNYKSIIAGSDLQIESFQEKQQMEKGLVDGGVYILDVQKFRHHKFPDHFSFKRDFLEAKVQDQYFQAYITNSYFLDIDKLIDFSRAQFEIGIFPKIDKLWTLFLDRDGVINEKIDNDYVKSADDFKILPSVIESIVKLSHYFGRIIIVTNQQGIGKGLMTEDDLEEVHSELIFELAQHGVSLDAIYHAPQLVSEQSIMRKPEIGMALKAVEDFQDIQLDKSLMIGDSISDMQFAINASMVPVYVGPNENETQAKLNKTYRSDSLTAFCELLTVILK